MWVLAKCQKTELLGNWGQELPAFNFCALWVIKPQFIRLPVWDKTNSRINLCVLIYSNTKSIAEGGGGKKIENLLRKLNLWGRGKPSWRCVNLFFNKFGFNEDECGYFYYGGRAVYDCNCRYFFNPVFKNAYSWSLKQ